MLLELSPNCAMQALIISGPIKIPQQVYIKATVKQSGMRVMNILKEKKHTDSMRPILFKKVVFLN